MQKLTHGFPVESNPTFHSSKPFPIENRYPPLPPKVDGGLLKKHLVSTNAQTLSDFHLLAYISTLAILSDGELQRACDIAVGKLQDADLKKLVQSDGWMTMDAILATENTTFKDKPASPAKLKAWTCRHCTYENTKPGDCEVCALPRD